MDIAKLSNIEKEAALNAMYSSPNGLQKIAAVMLNPIIRDLLHEGRGRQCLAIDKLQQGMDATYDSDVSAKACVCSADGVPQLSVIESGRFIVPTFPIGVQASIKWVESNYRKFDMINRTQERAKSALQSVEDKRIFDLISFASTQHYAAQDTTDTGRVSLLDLAIAKATLEKGRVPAAKMVMTPVRAVDVELLYNGTSYGPLFLPQTSEANVNKGLGKNILGMDIVTVPDGDTVTRVINGKEVIEDLPIITDNEIFVLGRPEMVGIMTIRQDVLVETQKWVRGLEDLFAIYEIVGFGVRYAKGQLKVNVKQA
jgi:hypothetical protein